MLEQDAIQSLGSLEPRCVDLDEGVFFGKTVLIGPNTFEPRIRIDCHASPLSSPPLPAVFAFRWRAAY